ncbi:guanine nucleotide-binding protein subunit beta-like protein 1 [Agrilus planipennis]|uniref:Guanine nucleotide-binding protein subunit beta-like protein 1 n=1 Tax=Agrilus planipennis TaxID=224129 RepID=A0A7F5R5N1_AGRPL|nr:guanine nucleotide-binding protein subunit beta-like protein 1 [Agrilus planipennis]
MAVLPPDPVFCLKSDMGYVHSLCFADNEENFSKTLYAATESGFVYVWDLDTNRLKWKQMLGTSIQVIHSIGNDLITQEKMGSIKRWAVNESEFILVHEYTCYGGYCRSLLMQNNVLVIPQEQSKLEALSITNMEKVQTFLPENNNLGNAMCLQKVELDKTIYILAGYETGDVLLWNFSSGTLCGHIKLRECITSLTFDPITCRGICGNSTNVLQVFTINKSFQITLKCEITVSNEGCNVVKIRPDRKIFVAGSWNGFLRVFSWKSLRPLAVLTEHKKPVTDVQFSPLPVKQWGGNIMAASGGDGIISLWYLYN